MLTQAPPGWVAVVLAAALLSAQSPPGGLPPEPVPQAVTAKIDLIQAFRDGGMSIYLNPKADVIDDPKEVFSVTPDGQLRVSGKAYGGLTTKAAYKDYHLVCEYKWGPRTWGKREKASRDSGVLVHCFGPDGANGGAWLASHEAQIIEGGTGDYLALTSRAPDGTLLQVSAMMEAVRPKGRGGMVWVPDAPRVKVTGGRVDWQFRDPAWRDVIGFRGKADVESPYGEWTRLEVIAKGDYLEFRVNGVLVNRAFECKPSSGRIQLQTEAAEMFVRRYELHPLGGFKETWPPAKPGKDAGARHAPEGVPPHVARPLEQLAAPGASAGTVPPYVAPEGFELIRAAHAGMVAHPTLGCVDPRGRLFVGDSPGTTWGAAQHEKAKAGRIVMMEDRDADGVFDRSTVFADGLTVPKGGCWLGDSLYVASPPGIWKLTDADGDGFAEGRRLMVGGFKWTANGADVHGPWAHPDGRLYWTHGRKGHDVRQADGTPVHSGLHSGLWSMNPDGSDVRWHAFAAADNPTGIAITEQGDILGTVNLHFGVPRSDTVLLWQLGAMYERPDYARLNAGLFRAHERMPLLHDLGHRVPSGCDLWTRANDLAPAGRPWSAHPSARQLLVSLYNSKQILRLELTPEGASYRATEHPFLTLKADGIHLTDVIEAPDGSLLVLDTGTWYPHCPSSLKSSGTKPGAIYRLRPAKPGAFAHIDRTPSLKPRTPGALAQAILGPDAAASRRALEEAAFRRLADPAIRAALLDLLARPLDPYLEHAALHAQHLVGAPDIALLKAGDSPLRQGRLLRVLSQTKGVPSEPLLDFALAHLDSPEPSLARRATLALEVDRAASARLQPLLNTWLSGAQLTAPRLAALANLADLLASEPVLEPVVAVALSHAAPEVRSLALRAVAARSRGGSPEAWRAPLLRLLAESPSPLVIDAAAKVRHRSLDPALRALSEDAARPKAVRLKALLALSGSDASRLETAAFDLLLDLLGDASDASLRLDAVRRLSQARLTDAQLDRFLPVLIRTGPLEHAEFLEVVREYTPAQGRRIAAALAQSPQLGTLQPDRVRVGFGRWPRDVFAPMEKAFDAAQAANLAKAARLDELGRKSALEGRAAEGAKVFASGKGACMACHKAGDLGRAVGPDLSRIGGIRTERELLESIVLPSNTLARDYETLLVTTSDGQSHLGLAKGRGLEGLTLMDVGGVTRLIPSASIVSETQVPQSLMPMGLDAAFSEQELLDLVAWMRSLR
ncbi:MAG: family 16 glycoside hydrolase [Opitutia bacterium]